MSEIDDWITALKRTLRARGITYTDVALKLNISESSVKRLFASRQISLPRLQAIADLADISLHELVASAEAHQRDVAMLTDAQEQDIVSDPKLLLVTFLLLNLWKVDDILAAYQLDALECTRLLARLDRLKIIDLLPGNRVRMRLARNFAWRPNGPIQRFFEQHVQSEFFSSQFNAPHELRVVLNGMLSDQSLALLDQRFRRLAADFDQLIKDDARLPTDQRHGMTTVLAMRPWGLSMFEQFRRPDPQT